MSTSDNSSYNPDAASRSYMMSAMLLAALIAAAGFIQFTVSSKEKALAQISAAAEHQLAMTQRVAMLAAQYEATHDENLLPMLKADATTTLSNHETLAPIILSSMARGMMTDPENTRAHALNTKIRDLVTKAFSYAGGASVEDARAYAEAISSMARQEIPDQWGAAVSAYVTAEQKNIDLLVKAGLGLCAAALLIAIYQLTALFAPAVQHIRSQREHLEHMGSTDMLTGFYNRAMLFKVVSTLISGARRHKHPLTALAVDIDEFKVINDKFGRAAGDTAIKKVAAALGEVLRTSDVMGRVGGAEFAVFLPSTDEYRASFAAEKLRAAIEALPFNVKDAVVLLRVSIGVAEMQPHHKTTDDVLRAAEAALRYAKDSGRNRVGLLSAMASGTPAPAPVTAQAAPAAAAAESAKTA
ncbi:MAG: GGDEF domain-containing protein [Alphaproteobacteria bacterium]|nr:MAG: GGDEF domain-containing protein [Alphaproteobacteria bacterium]